MLLLELTLSMELDDFDLFCLLSTGTPLYCDVAMCRIVVLISVYRSQPHDVIIRMLS